MKNIEKSVKHQFREVAKIIPHEEVAVSKMETTTPTREKSSAVGNAAAMLKALEKVRRVLHCAIVADILKGDDVNGAFNEVIAALSAPQRNCDIGTSEEQAERFYSFCKKFQSDIQGMCSPQCPCIGCRDMFHCLTKWTQMPYEEEGAK